MLDSSNTRYLVVNWNFKTSMGKIWFLLITNKRIHVHYVEIKLITSSFDRCLKKMNWFTTFTSIKYIIPIFFGFYMCLSYFFHYVLLLFHCIDETMNSFTDVMHIWINFIKPKCKTNNLYRLTKLRCCH